MPRSGYVPPFQPAPGPASTAGERHQRLGSTWQITLEHAAGVCSATRRSPDGRHTRVITGPSAAGLAADLETAEQGQP